MAEEEITVSAPTNPNYARPYPGLSPLKAGLLYGGAASTVMGPLGLLVGVASGIAAKKMRDNYLDRQSAYLRNVQGEHEEFAGDLAQEIKSADPDEQRMLQVAKRMETDGWLRLRSGDGTGRDMIDQANTIMRGIIQGDISQRKQEESANAAFQRGLISTAATSMREEYQQNMQMFNEVDKQSSRVLDLVADKDFDPNKPFNKAILAELLSTGIGGFYKDAPDVLDAAREGSGALSKIPVVGEAASDIVGALISAVKANDFKLTPEDYNRVALNMKGFNEKYATRKMDQLGQQARNLDNGARQIGAIGPDYSLADYVSGGVKELQLTPVPKYTPPTVKEAPRAPGRTAVPDVRSTPQWKNQTAPIIRGQSMSPATGRKYQLRPTN
jgi:hypothetical protein